MSFGLGMGTAWRAMQPKKKRCPRCGLYNDESTILCGHCTHLDKSQLAALKKQHKKSLKGNVALGKGMLMCAVVIAFILLLSFF